MIWQCDKCDNQCIKKAECRLGDRKEAECMLMNWAYFEKRE